MVQKNDMFALQECCAVKRDKLPQQIIRNIRNMVLDGRLKPGDKLPSEQELIKTFSVSRQTIREVLRVLEAQGLLSIRPGAGGGTFVREVDIDVTRQSLINFLHQTDLSLQHLFQLRQILDPYFAEIAAKTMSFDDLQALAQIVATQKRYLDEGNLAEARRAEIQFHRELARVTDNPLLILLQDFIETLLEKIKAQLSPDRAFSQHSLDWHSRVIEALERQDADSARRAMLADLASVEADLLKLGAEKDKINWK